MTKPGILWRNAMYGRDCFKDVSLHNNLFDSLLFSTCSLDISWLNHLESLMSAFLLLRSILLGFLGFGLIWLEQISAPYSIPILRFAPLWVCFRLLSGVYTESWLWGFAVRLAVVRALLPLLYLTAYAIQNRNYGGTRRRRAIARSGSY